MEEFAQVDVNRDGCIDREELRNFFINKGITDPEQLTSIVDEIFEQIDEDADGTISQEEFVNKFMETKARLEQLKIECMHKMIDHDRQLWEVEGKLE